MDTCRLDADDTFGPVVSHCRGGFDFTLLFEQAILSILPSVLVLAASVYRLLGLRRQSVKTITKPRAPWVTAKQTAIGGYAITQLVLVILWAIPGHDATRVSVAASAVSLATAIVLSRLSYAEHNRSAEPSGILNFYLTFSILFDVAQARTLWLRANSTAISAVFTVGIVLKTVMLGVEMVGKRGILQAPYRDWSPEALGGIMNRSVFWWINSLLHRGSGSILKQSDLFPLDPDLQSLQLRSKLIQAWERSDKKSQHSLLFTTIVSLRKPMLEVVMPRIALSAFKICQPLLVNRAVSLLSEPASQRKTDVGRALIGATALVYIGIAITTAMYKHQTYRYITMMRGALVSLVYDRTLSLNLGAVSDGAAITLMSTDIERIAAGFEWTDALWAGPIELAIATYILYTQIGYSCFAPLILSIIFLAIWGALSGASANYQMAWMEAIQSRVSSAANVIGNMKGIKGSGLSDVFAADLQRLRVDELKASAKFRQILALFSILGNFSGAATPVLTLIIYMLVMRATTSTDLDPAVAFTSISLVSLLGAPVQQFAMALLNLAAATGCFQRIQQYIISTDEQRDSSSDLSFTSDLKDTAQVQLKDLKSDADEPRHGQNMVLVESASFSFTPDGPAVLNDISITLSPGSWTVITGPVGSGKSALLLALLGEMHKSKGSVDLRPTRMAFCAQDAWLPNQSIRSLIIGTSEFDEDLYSTVLSACELHQDLKILSKGDESVAGSKGTSLSGGQKQRIALARALYARPSLLLLDDVLSGLDPTTERRIVDNVFGPRGICRKNNTTVLLATHTVSAAREADQVIMMGTGGVILKQGSPASLDLISSGSDIKESSTPVEEVSDADTPADTPGPSAPAIDPEDLSKKEAEDDLTRKTGDIRLYFYYFRSVGWAVTTVLFVSCAVFSWSAQFPTLWLKWWSDANGENTTMYMTVYGMFCVICLLALTFGVWTLAMVGIPKSSNKLHEVVLHTMMSAPYWFFVSTDSGQTLNRFSQDMSLIDMALPVALVEFSFAVFLCIMSAVLIALGSKWTALMYPPMAIILYVLQKFYLRTSRQMRYLDLEAKSPLYSHFMETLQGLSTIRAFGWQEPSRIHHHQILDTSQQPFYLMYAIQRWLNLVLDIVVAVVATFTMALATQLPGASDSGLGVSLSNILSFSGTMALLVSVWAELETSLGAVSRVRAFAKTTPSEHLPEEVVEPPVEWPTKGEIIFSNFAGSYKSPSEKVLQNIDLKIEAGEKIAICGRTGSHANSGKSSFILSILRLVEKVEGNIMLDGLALSDIPRARVRKGVTSIPQDPLIYRGTVRFNADPLLIHSDEDIVSALKEVNVWGVLSERGGLDADMDTVGLSRGEQQLFCLSRAILAKPRVLILDEVTSSVDRAQEDEVVKMLHRNFEGTTILMVVHHLRMVRNFDKILVLSEGEIVEWDHPDTLMLSDSVFRRLLSTQEATNEGE
ncbi:unnamed protein product [Clonostachys solani]|uniref:Uncharacterized protein n=1 Tax=Clonostachys solani TaxID=160281 RepID=A0A9N9VZX2_9HYPO|nr:unnamed protein product [Clonostachys solani]